MTPRRFLAALGMTMLAATAGAQQQPVAPVDWSRLSPSMFRDDELDLPYYLANFSRVANSIALSGERRGFIDLAVWRNTQDNAPHNARIMENILSLAWFYVTERPWNQYRGDPALRARLEAALDFWVRSQSPDGRFSEYAPQRWGLAPTAFATKFMGEALRLLSLPNAPPIDTALYRRAVEADRKAILATFTNADLIAHGRAYTNQFGNVWGGALSFTAVHPDARIDSLLRVWLERAETDHQSPAGYFYEADGPDWGYDLNTHHSDFHAAWQYARGTPIARYIVEPTRRWYEWFGYNAVPEPNETALTLNRAIESRQRHATVEAAGAGGSAAGNPLAEVVPEARVLGPTREDLARERAARRSDVRNTWPRTDSLRIGDFSAFSPYAFLHRDQVRWSPTDAQRHEAVLALRHQKEERFNHQRADSRHPIVFTYVRRPSYYAALTTGQVITAQQRYGLGLLWAPDVGTVLQSQSAATTTAWGTRRPDTSLVYEASTFAATYRVRDSLVTPTPGARDLPRGELRIEYPLGTRGSKTISFDGQGVHVAVTHAGAFVEQLPLLALPTDSITSASGVVALWRGGAHVGVHWKPASDPRVERTNEPSGKHRVVAVAIPGSGKLTYDIDITPAPNAARSGGPSPTARGITRRELEQLERPRVLAAANRYLKEAPITITAYRAERSTGGLHDFYSEGDYWWPDPKNPNGPYVRRDGETNPDNFVAHRDAMRRLSQIVPALVAAYELTRDARYARQATAHLRAWFVADATRMNPNLLYGQAIKGVATGRGIGIIDTIHLVEVAQAVRELERLGAIDRPTLDGVRRWFADYLAWMTTHPYGLDEKNNGNNHSAAWALQVAAFARLVGDSARVSATRRFFEDTLVPQQMALDGSFPRELARTKPYGYSLFQLDVMGMLAEALSDTSHDEWSFATPDGRGMRRALAFMYPYIADKRTWPKPPDVQFHDQWPIRHPSLLFGGRALGESRYVTLWRRLEPDPTVDEVIRNYPVRQPLLWLRAGT